MKLRHTHKLIVLVMLLTVILSLLGCNRGEDTSGGKYYSFTDSLSHVVSFNEKPTRVVCLIGSYAEIALNAGLNVIGVTSDAISERNLSLNDNVEIVGTVKEPNIEKIISVKPDLVILSTDIAAHISLASTLTRLGIKHCFFKEESFSEYLVILKHLSTLSGSKTAYNEYGLEVKAKIDSELKELPKQKKIVLYRVYSSGQRAKNKDTVAGKILFDLNCDNIADRYPSTLDILSDEAVIAFNPELIFIVPMGASGDKNAAAAVESILSKAVFSEVLAVQKKKVIALSKELFHYKPNHRWGESYSYAKKILSE